MKLTKPQLRQLRAYEAGADGFSPTYAPDKVLLKLGLIERWDAVENLLPTGGIKIVIFHARLTTLGKQVLAQYDGKK